MNLVSILPSILAIAALATVLLFVWALIIAAFLGQVFSSYYRAKTSHEAMLRHFNSSGGTEPSQRDQSS